MITLLFTISIPQLVSAKSSTVLGSRAGVWEQEEIDADVSITNTITSYSSIADYNAYNWYGANTTQSSICEAAYGVGHFYSISFYIGDGDRENPTHFWGWPWQWHEHVAYFITDDNGTLVYDEDIYDHTSCQNVKFVYLWSCKQGNEIGSMMTYPCGEVDPCGMPFAWLHTSCLSSDGYVNPDSGDKLFIGFEDLAPWLTNDDFGAIDAGYNFLQYFYYASLHRGYYYSVNAALDYAAQYVWGTSYADCILRTGYDDGRMKVYGNGNIHISDHGGGGGGWGGGCPTVFAWNGTDYVLDNNVLPASELGNGTDVEDHYRLEMSPTTRNGKYSLLLSEFEREHSYIDQVKLLAVDHESDVQVAVTPNGEILTYKNPIAPLSAIDDNGIDRLGQIRFMDGNVSAPNTYFYGLPDDYLTLNFGQVNSDTAKLIFRTDMKKDTETCILVQIKNGTGAWQTVDVLVPRAYWSMEAVNLSPYIIQGQDLWIRLYWKDDHRLDYVGLDTTRQDDYQLHTANLVSAAHSTQGNVKTQLLASDNRYAELIPGQQIQLDFTLPRNTHEARTYILCTKGRYYTMP
jgi:hypothetical protein